MTLQKATNIKWQEGYISKADREKLNGHKGAVIWFTGLSGSGKSTLARELERRLFQRKIRCYVLDGDNIRHGLNKNLGFSPEDREENIRRVGEVARLFADAGIIAITAFISPYIKDRDRARSLNPPGEFIEIYCRCSIEECERRDTKGLYKKARMGELKDFTGIDAPYEPPPEPELILDTEKDSIETCIEKIISFLENNDIIARSV